jgi:hypothetical protein
MLRSLLGLECVRGKLLVDAQLPQGTGWFELLDIPGAWGRADAYGRGLIEVDIEPLETTVLGRKGTSVTMRRGAEVVGAR